MEITEIIKEAFIFPSNGLGKLAIYIVLTILCGILAFGGIFLMLEGMESTAMLILGILLVIIALIIGFIISGYQLDIIKSGIDHTESAPEFIWKENLLSGIKYMILNIVYLIIPAIVVYIVANATGLIEKSSEVFYKIMVASINAPANVTVTAADVVPQSLLVDLGTAMIITGIVAFILFVIFAIIKAMGESRLANTGSLKEGLNIPEAFRDIGRIGWGKVLAIIILVFVIIMVINAIINGLNSYISGIGILSIIATPYLTFFAARSTGLLYSDIA